MTAFFLISSLLFLTIFLYEMLSMVYPLHIPLFWKILCAALLLCAAFKEVIFRFLGGGMSFAPLLPRWVMLTGAVMYNFLVVAMILLILKDAVWLFWKIANACKLVKAVFPASAASWLVIAVSLALTFYGTWEAVRVPDVERHEVSIPGLEPEFDGMRVALLVDLHASALNRRPFIQSIVESVNALSPDVILIPGDFVDGSVDERREDLEPLSGLKATHGVFGTSGNHEYYSGYGEWKKQLTAFGVRMLENEHAVLTSGDGKLIIAGVPDQQGARPGFGFTQPFEAPDVDKALRGAPNAPVILMDHRPVSAAKNAEAGVALQLSGHTHGGQMPVVEQIISRFNHGYVRGWYDVGPMKLYVSRGTSQWSGFAMRLFDSSEITLLILRSPGDVGSNLRNGVTSAF